MQRGCFGNCVRSLASTSTLSVLSSSLTTASWPFPAAHDSGVWPLYFVSPQPRQAPKTNEPTPKAPPKSAQPSPSGIFRSVHTIACTARIMDAKADIQTDPCLIQYQYHYCTHMLNQALFFPKAENIAVLRCGDMLRCRPFSRSGCSRRLVRRLNPRSMLPSSYVRC